MRKSRIDRRGFITTTARGAAAAAVIGPGVLLRGSNQRSPNDTVRIGVIGFGVQGLNDANAALRLPNVQVVAAASCYDGHLERARELLGEEALRTRDYRQILDRKDVDAVIVSAPDHWHTRICLDALAAGKDVYCEKPMTHFLEEGERLLKAVKGRKHPFDPRRVFRWRTYREYGEGLAGDVLVHIITALHYMLNLQAPTVATAVGGRLRWKDDRNVYDTITGGWEYPEGIVTVLGATQNNHYDETGIRILGTKATMVMTFGSYTVYEENDQSNWRYTTNVWPKDLRDEYWTSKGLPLNPDPAAGPPPRPERKMLKQFQPVAADRRRPYHMEHFVDCIRSRQQPVQDVVMGNNAAIAAHMANLAYYNKKTIQFDRAAGKLLTPVSGSTV
ncbi:MAG: Gfo/Idh/MocA family oxidoreductase [Acidobacteria bacterium]|nr:Gfo/Idh/MocA family oxidoreductase [Acidobacteriota bacterium]